MKKGLVKRVNAVGDYLSNRMSELKEEEEDLVDRKIPALKDAL